MKLYAIHGGPSPGIYSDWETAKRYCQGVGPGVRCKSFYDLSEALAYVNGSSSSGGHRTGWIPSPPTGALVVWTDGSYLKGTGAAGWGVYVEPGDSRNACGTILPSECNGYSCSAQRGELLAMMRACSMAADGLVHVVTDSEYALKCAAGWGRIVRMRHDPRKGPDPTIPHADIICCIQDLINANVGRISFEKVKAHSGIHGNEGADRLAKMGASKRGGRV